MRAATTENKDDDDNGFDSTAKAENSRRKDVLDKFHCDIASKEVLWSSLLK